VDRTVDLYYPIAPNDDALIRPLSETVHLIHQLVLTRDYARIQAILRTALRSDDLRKL